MRKGSLLSNRWSCSELEKAQQQLAAIKKEEHSDDDALSQEIIDTQHDKQLHGVDSKWHTVCCARIQS